MSDIDKEGGGWMLVISYGDGLPPQLMHGTLWDMVTKARLWHGLGCKVKVIRDELRAEGNKVKVVRDELRAEGK